MIDSNAKRQATQAVREARQIDDALTEKGGHTITVPVLNTPEFWAGINLLLQGEYVVHMNTFSAFDPDGVAYITLRRRQP